MVRVNSMGELRKYASELAPLNQVKLVVDEATIHKSLSLRDFPPRTVFEVKETLTSTSKPLKGDRKGM